MATKACIDCGTVLEVNEDNFYKSKRGKDGFINQCKPCRNKKIKDRRISLGEEGKRQENERSKKWKLENPEYVKAYTRERTASGKAKSSCKKWRDGNLELARELTRQWQKNNPEKKKKSERNYVENNPQKRADQDRHQKLKSKYGLTLEKYRIGCKLQENKCAICKKKCGSLCVDHNHETGVVRGLLCSTCNLMIGYAQDNPKILRDAAKYLKNPPGLLAISEENNWLEELESGIMEKSEETLCPKPS